MYIKKLLFNIFHWEAWHYHLKYIPISPVWLWYCIRARSLWFFTASNPSITFGGFEGEGKDEIYRQLPCDTYPKSILISADVPFDSVENERKEKGFEFPFIVKPDVGMMGYMFRKISSKEELKLYHEVISVDYIIQKFVEYPIEVSVFYYRMPDSDKGTISGFLMKQQPEVTGDGKSTLAELITRNEDLKYKQNEMMARHQKHLDLILPENEKLILSYASNRSQGGKLVSLAHEIDARLVDIFDKISAQTKYFYYGRYDIKCESIESLKSGKNFSILEYNGAGAGIQHVYGNHLALSQACKTILAHWCVLYKISMHNKKINKIDFWEQKRGKKFLKNARKQLNLLKKLDAEFPVF
jgi:hypothetical protein